MPALFTIIVVVAVASWAVAIWSCLRLVSLSRRGGRLRTLADIGWWRFDEIESRIGVAAGRHIVRFRRAFVAFFLSILAGATTGVAANLIDAPAN